MLSPLWPPPRPSPLAWSPAPPTPPPSTVRERDGAGRGWQAGVDGSVARSPANLNQSSPPLPTSRRRAAPVAADNAHRPRQLPFLRLAAAARRCDRLARLPAPLLLGALSCQRRPHQRRCRRRRPRCRRRCSRRHARLVARGHAGGLGGAWVVALPLPRPGDGGHGPGAGHFRDAAHECGEHGRGGGAVPPGELPRCFELEALHLRRGMLACFQLASPSLHVCPDPLPPSPLPPFLGPGPLAGLPGGRAGLHRRRRGGGG